MKNNGNNTTTRKYFALKALSTGHKTQPTETMIEEGKEDVKENKSTKEKDRGAKRYAIKREKGKSARSSGSKNMIARRDIKGGA